MQSLKTMQRPLVYDSGTQPHPAVEEAVELFRYRDLLFQWTARNIKLRYKRSALGVLWTLLEPLMMMSILTVVFSSAFRSPLAKYPVYLLSGYLLFDFFSRSTTQMIDEIIASQNLARRVYVPLSIFAVASVLTHLVNWMIALVPLFAIALIYGQPVTLAIVTLPVGVLLTALFALGLGLTVSTLASFFHDIKLAYGVLLTALFYATPILYPIEVISERFRVFFEMNPLYHLCRLVRDPVYLGQAAPLAAWLIGASASLLAAATGWWVFSRSRKAIEYHG